MNTNFGELWMILRQFTWCQLKYPHITFWSYWCHRFLASHPQIGGSKLCTNSYPVCQVTKQPIRQANCRPLQQNLVPTLLVSIISVACHHDNSKLNIVFSCFPLWNVQLLLNANRPHGLAWEKTSEKEITRSKTSIKGFFYSRAKCRRSLQDLNLSKTLHNAIL